MARITASLYMSHVPAIGAAVDKGLTEEPYWQPLFNGIERGRVWIKANPPDVVILVYNDHGNAFSFEPSPGPLRTKGWPAPGATRRPSTTSPGATPSPLGCWLMRWLASN